MYAKLRYMTLLYLSTFQRILQVISYTKRIESVQKIQRLFEFDLRIQPLVSVSTSLLGTTENANSLLESFDFLSHGGLSGVEVFDEKVAILM